MIKLREYQSEAVKLIDQEFEKGNRRVIYKANTGAGKTEVMCYLARRCVEFNFPCVVVVRGREIVKNMSLRLDRYKIDHSVFMSKHYRYNLEKKIQVTSIDTLLSRDKWPYKDKPCLIMIDEAHKDYKDIFINYPEHYIIGLTATPYGDNSIYSSVICPIEGFELRDMGFLVPEKIYCPNIIDVSGIKKTAGEFNRKELNNVVTQSAIVGDIVEDWKKYGNDRPTLCFAVSVEHSMQLAQRFNEAGVPAVHCDAKSKDYERDIVSKDIVSGKIKVICNVDIFSTGWDCPPISCIVLARPTLSVIWYLQAIGRGIRSYANKDNCIIIDSAGNALRHGGPYRIRPVSLEKPVKNKKNITEINMVTCGECFFVYDHDVCDACPDCGFVQEKKIRKINTVEGELVEFVESPEKLREILLETIKRKYRQLSAFRRMKNLNKTWLFTALGKQFKDEDLREALGVAYPGASMNILLSDEELKKKPEKLDCIYKIIESTNSPVLIDAIRDKMSGRTKPNPDQIQEALNFIIDAGLGFVYKKGTNIMISTTKQIGVEYFCYINKAKFTDRELILFKLMTEGKETKRNLTRKVGRPIKANVFDNIINDLISEGVVRVEKIGRNLPIYILC